MACCNSETFAYPAWWAGASTVRIYLHEVDIGSPIVFEGSVADVEFLPQGVAYATELAPWNRVYQIRKLS
jgi:hypothetical protein